MNLLEGTIYEIIHSGHTIEDIIHIGNEKYECSWEEFVKLANIDYQEGFGGQKVAMDLMIIFKDGQVMIREEYDGDEWRQFKKEDKVYKKISNLSGEYWAKLDDLNNEATL